MGETARTSLARAGAKLPLEIRVEYSVWESGLGREGRSISVFLVNVYEDMTETRIS